MTLREKAATALDLTHHVGERGPGTFMARGRLAAWLDGAARMPKSHVVRDVKFLMEVAGGE